MYGILIDKNGFKIKFDMLKFLEQEILENDESIIEKDWAIANSMNKPKWDFDNEVWVDTDPLPPVETPTPQTTEIEILKEENNDLKAMIGTLSTMVLQIKMNV